MNRVLIDSSIWIDYFNKPNCFNILSDLIKQDLVCTNNLILSEILPVLLKNKQQVLVESLLELKKIDIQINWDLIISLQLKNLKNGINNVSIPDLIILENVIEHNLILFSQDKHFLCMKNIFNFKLFDKQNYNFNNK